MQEKKMIESIKILLGISNDNLDLNKRKRLGKLKKKKVKDVYVEDIMDTELMIPKLSSKAMKALKLNNLS